MKTRFLGERRRSGSHRSAPVRSGRRYDQWCQHAHSASPSTACAGKAKQRPTFTACGRLRRGLGPWPIGKCGASGSNLARFPALKRLPEKAWNYFPNRLELFPTALLNVVISKRIHLFRQGPTQWKPTRCNQRTQAKHPPQPKSQTPEGLACDLLRRHGRRARHTTASRK